MAKRRSGNGAVTKRQKKGGEAPEGANRVLSPEEFDEFWDEIDTISQKTKEFNASQRAKIGGVYKSIKDATGFTLAMLKRKYAKRKAEREEAEYLDGLDDVTRGQWEALSEQLGEENPLGAYAARKAAEAGEGQAH